MFEIFFILFFALFIFIFIRNISEWVNNNNSPRLSVDARIVAKRRVTHHHHHANGHIHHSHTYRVTFEVRSGDRMELKVPRDAFGFLEEGDFGVLSFQGTRYLGFERTSGDFHDV
ncbi:MAG: DUF2500 domain-containing protein [Clostridia bacterium]|nr:DUF2500 domain-containing protein [Clostridia bacterium]MBR6745710.1 DUF2500 domain-containing protein [Clostridia bacterium]